MWVEKQVWGEQNRCQPAADGSPSVSGSAQGFFQLSAWEFFLATVALGLLIGGQFSVKQLCDKAPLLKAL